MHSPFSLIGTPSCGTAARPLRLLAIGDCNTGGAEGCCTDDRVPSRLAARLAAAGLPCVEQNLGQTMSTTREGLARTRAQARPADLVLLNFGLVDAWMTSIPRVYVSYYPDRFAKRRARKLLKSVKRRLRTPLLRRFVPMGEVVPIAEYEANLRGILHEVRAANPSAQLLLWGTVPVLGDEPRNRNIVRYNEVLRSLAQAAPGAWYLDPFPCFEALTPSERYLDHLHLSRPAADRVAAAMAELCLTQMPLLPNIRARRHAA